MSHFTVLVIGNEPEKQLEPFNEQIVMPRYVSKTKEQIISEAKKDIEDYTKSSYYTEFNADPVKYREECKNEAHIKYLEETFPAKLSWTDEEIYNHEIEMYEPEEITPDGGVYSTYNPNSKWDWHQLGGRWAGQILVKEGVDYQQANFSWGWDDKDKNEVLKERRTDQALKKDIANLDDLVMFALLKDGVWYEKGEMGWFAIVTNGKDENQWAEEFKKLINELPDDTLLSVYDCHI